MKIVMLCDFYVHSLQYQENLLAKYYRKQGHEVTILASTFESIFDYMSDKYDSKIKANETIVDGVKIIKLPYTFNILNKRRKLVDVNSILGTEKPDVIFAHSIHLNLKEAVKYKKKNPAVKIIMDYHADYSNSANNWFSLNILHRVVLRSFFHHVKKYIDQIYPIVPASSNFLHDVYGIPYEKMEVLPLGVDIDNSDEIRCQNRGKNISEKYGIAINDFVVFTGGKLDIVKRTDLLIEAINNLSNPQIHLLIGGVISEKDIKYKAKLENLIKKNRQIHFAGWLGGEEIYEFMDASDVAIFPASQSVLWQQSIGMGLPLIIGPVVNVNGKTWVQDADYLNVNNNIIILDKYNISAQGIAEKIKRLINDPTLLNTMKVGALKTTAEFLSYDKIIQRTLSF